MMSFALTLMMAASATTGSQIATSRQARTSVSSHRRRCLRSGNQILRNRLALTPFRSPELGIVQPTTDSNALTSHRRGLLKMQIREELQDWWIWMTRRERGGKYWGVRHEIYLQLTPEERKMTFMGVVSQILWIIFKCSKMYIKWTLRIMVLLALWQLRSWYFDVYRVGHMGADTHWMHEVKKHLYGIDGFETRGSAGMEAFGGLLWGAKQYRHMFPDQWFPG